MAIDLDAWTGPEPADRGPFVVFDVEHLPAGWTLASPLGGYHPIGDPDPTHYTWEAVLARLRRSRRARHGQQPGVADATPSHADRGRRSGRHDRRRRGLVARPTRARLQRGQPGSQRERAGGWALGSADDATTGVSLTIGGEARTSSGTAHRVVDDTWDANLTGLGLHGTLLSGLAPAEVGAVRVVTDDATMTLPVVHDVNGVAIWAVPVPPGLAPRELHLMSESGSALNRVRLPTFLTPVAGGDSSQDRPLDGTFPTFEP